MRRLFAGLIVVAVFPFALPADEAADNKAAVAFRALQEEHEGKPDAAKTAEDRKEVHRQFAVRYLQFAEKNAKASVAFFALVQCVEISRDKDGPATKALAILEKDHAGNKAMRSEVAKL